MKKDRKVSVSFEESLKDIERGAVNNDISSYYGVLIILVFVVYYVFVK